MFSTDKGVKRFTMWVHTDSNLTVSEQKTVFQKIKDLLNTIAKKIRKFVKGKKFVGAEEMLLNENERTILDGEEKFASNLMNQFLSAVDTAIENRKAATVNENATAEGAYSIGVITDEKGNEYGIGVILDSNLLTGLTDSERIVMIKEYVKELGGQTFSAFKGNGEEVLVKIVESNKKFKNKNGKKIRANHDLAEKYSNNKTKQEAIALIDELITTAQYGNSSASNYPHGWLDNYGKNDWEYWYTYVQDENKDVWKVTLNISTTKVGEKILYDITSIKKEAGRSSSVDTNDASYSISISENDDVVNPLNEKELRVAEVTNFNEERREAQLWSLEGVQRFNAQKDLYSKYQQGVANKDTFFRNTMAEFSRVSRRPSNFPDYVSRNRYGEISSEYWYKDDGVIRGSKHWGLDIRSCDWKLEGVALRSEGVALTSKLYGFCKWEDFIYKTGIENSKFDEKTGSYTDFSEASLSSFDSEKNSSGTEFSLKMPVEETKDLLAVHNLRQDELLKSLGLGGLPMPSIAIIKAQNGHNEYGDVSLIFNKDTIDPSVRGNNVYGGDAWTPSFPDIEYKANETVQNKISDKYYELSKKLGYDSTRALSGYVNDIERKLSKGESKMLSELYEDTDMMNLFRQDTGLEKIEDVKNTVETKMSDAEIEESGYVLEKLPDLVEELKTSKDGSPFGRAKRIVENNLETVKNAFREMYEENYGFTSEEAENAISTMTVADYAMALRNAKRYSENNGVTVREEVDTAATKEKIKSETDQKAYKEWVDGLFKGIEEKQGIRNNKDPYTAMGDRRSFESLHYEVNLENIVKAMKEESPVANSFFGASGIWGASAKQYNSISEIKEDSKRLKKVSTEEYEAIREGFGQRLTEIANSILDTKESNRFIALDNAMTQIVEAVKPSKTKSGILSELRKYNKSATELTASDIYDLVNDIANMPTEYFEAKPNRAVGFDEVKGVLIPSNASEELKTALSDGGFNTVEYEAGNDKDRIAKLNEFEDAEFSIKIDDKTMNEENFKKPINVGDIETLRSIGRKSINAFTSEDIQKSQKWAYKFYLELGTKSPFFRAWFGDWRANNSQSVTVADIPEYVASNEARKVNRGNVRNNDTGWDIRISREGESNTISHAGDMRLSEYGLAGIRGLIENAVLLDSEVHEHHGNNAKNDLIAFDHKLYAIGKDINGNVALYKITVEEGFQDPYNTNDKKFHNLKYIEKVVEASADANVEQSHKDGSTMRSSTTDYTISDLYGFVKKYDKDFKAGKEVNSDFINDDGTPKTFYHGAKKNGGFTEFHSWQYFTEQKGYAERYAERGNNSSLYAVYLQANKVFDTREAEARSLFESIRQEEGLGELQDTGLPDWTDGYSISEYLDGHPELGYDAIVLDEGGDLIDGEPISRGESFVIKDSTQIKSATENIGTFDSGNNDIRYSIRMDDNSDLRKSLLAQNERYEKALKEAKEKIKTLREETYLTHGKKVEKKAVRALITRTAQSVNARADIDGLTARLETAFNEALKTGDAA